MREANFVLFMFLFGEGRRGCPGLVARSGTKFVTTFDFGLFCVNYMESKEYIYTKVHYA